jgi:hypothetical protein
MRWAEMWDEWRMEPERLIDAGRDQVIPVFREIGRSESGLQMDERHAELYTGSEGETGLQEGLLRSRRRPRSRRAAGAVPRALLIDAGNRHERERSPAGGRTRASPTVMRSPTSQPQLRQPELGAP